MHFIKRLPHATSLLITGLSGLLLSTFLAAFVWHKQVDAWHDRFDNGVRVRQQEITNLLSDALVALDRLGRFAEASEQVTREEFDYFTAPLLGNFTSLYMIRPVPVAGGALSGFAPAVVPRDLRAGCQAVDAALRYPVVLYKTADPGTNALGLDLRCDADRVAAMRSAGGSGRVVATRQIRRLMHDGLTMALFRPLYARSAQSDQSGRRALLGYVGAGVAMQMVLKPRLTAMQDNDNYVLSLTDADATGGLRLLSLGSDPAVASAPMAALRLDMAGRNLQLDIRPSAAFWAQRHDQTPALVWLGGVAFTLLLMAWLHSQNTRRVQAEMLAIARNDDVIDREARLTALFQHAPIAILRCDEQGTIADANPAAGRLVASEAGVLAGRQYISLFVPWAAEVFRERWQEPAWLELELAGDGGEPIPALVRTLSMRQPDGTPYAWVMIEDLRLVRHNERLKREFVATVSHELRTPLTAIKGAIELAQSGVMGTYSEEVGHLLDMAAQNTEALTRLINDLLDVERLEQGKLSLHLREQALLPLLERARRLSQPLLNDKRLTWGGRVEDGSLRVRVDGDRLVQVFKNLFSNAVKFSPPGGCIDVDVICAGEHVSIRVSDQGSGIPADFLPRLFQPFAQADGSDQRAAGGSGLGLAISRGLIERMGGHIHAESVPGQGASFIIDLPVIAAATGTDPTEEGEHAFAQHTAG